MVEMRLAQRNVACVARGCSSISKLQDAKSRPGVAKRITFVYFEMPDTVWRFILLKGEHLKRPSSRDHGAAEPSTRASLTLYRGPAAKRDQCSGPRRRTGSVFPGWPDQCSLVGPRPPRRIPSRTARATRCIAHVNARQVAALANRHGRTFECLRVWNVGKSKRKAIFRPGLSQTGAKFALRLATH